MSQIGIFPFVLLGFAALLPYNVLAASVSAELVINGKAFKPTEIVAFRVRQGRNPRNFLTEVVLTTQPVNADKIQNSLNPSPLREDPATQGDYLDLSIFPDGSVQVSARVDGDTIYFGDVSLPPGGPEPGELAATCKANTPTHIACSVKSKEPAKISDNRTCTLNLAFDAEVLAPPAGKSLVQDGGDPGKAFRALYAASNGNDLDAVLALLLPKPAAKAHAARYAPFMPLGVELHPGDDLRRLKVALDDDFVLPKHAKVTGGRQLTGDYALLEVEGKQESERHPSLYLVEMRRVEGTWRYVNANGVGTLWDEQ